jgi:hypothetical protein
MLASDFWLEIPSSTLSLREPVYCVTRLGRQYHRVVFALTGRFLAAI